MNVNNRQGWRLFALAFCCLLAWPANSQRVMNLKECIAAARIGNTSAKDAKNDLLAAVEQQKYARSKYYPMLGVSATHFQSSDHLVKAQLFSDDFREALQELDELIKMDFVGDLEFIKNGTLLGLTALEPVYTGGRLTSYNKLADLQVDAREKLISVTDDQIVQTTQFLYYKIVEMHDLDKTFATIEEELKSIHQDAVNIYENGIVNKNDVLSVELMQDQVSALRIKTANACRLLRRALAKYMGMANEDIDVDTRIDTDISDPETLRTSPLEATLNRTETQLLDIWVQKSQLESKIAKANMLPIVLVGGSLNYSKLLSNWQGKAVAFATLQMPISALWSERHEYKRKKIEEQKALDFRQDKRELITLQIMDAWDNLESAYRQTQIAEKSIVRAEENLRIQREYYRNGLTNMTILLDAQRQQQTALTQRTTAVSEYLQAKTKYLILTGRRNY